MVPGIAGLTMYETATRRRSRAIYKVDSAYDTIAAAVNKIFVIRRCRMSHMQRPKSAVYAPVRGGVNIQENRADRRRAND